MVATDGSGAQLAAAISHERVSYAVGLAENSALRAASFDLVTVAQALHWLDVPAFFREARRVLVADGVIAAWCYGLLEIDDRVDALIQHFYEETVGPYWTAERRLVDTGYRTIAFPFEELRMPPLAIELELSLDQLAGYLRTWSAARKYAEERGEDPVAPLVEEIARLWGRGAAPRRARWPLSFRVGRYRGGN